MHTAIRRTVVATEANVHILFQTQGNDLLVDANVSSVFSQADESDPRCVIKTVHAAFSIDCLGEYPLAKAIAFTKPWWVMEASSHVSGRAYAKLQRAEVVAGQAVSVYSLRTETVNCVTEETRFLECKCCGVGVLKETRDRTEYEADFTEEIWQFKLDCLIPVYKDFLFTCGGCEYKVHKVTEGPTPTKLMEVEAVKTAAPRA